MMRKHFSLLFILVFVGISSLVFAQNCEDIIPFRKGDLWGYVDKNKAQLIESTYDDAYRFDPICKLALVRKQNLWGAIDSTGKLVLPIEFEDIIFNSSMPLMKVKKDGQWNLMFTNGVRFLVKWYDDVSWPVEGMIAIRQDRGPQDARIEKWGFADKSKLPVIKPMFDKVGNFDQGLAMVQVGKKFGFIDRKGEYVVEPKYINAKTFLDGLAPVSWPDGEDKIKGIKFQKWGYVDTKGALAIALKYRNVWHFFENRASVVNEYGMAGHIDKKGHTVTPFEYHETRDFLDGIALVRKYDQWGYVDTTGKEIIPVKYIFARPFSEGLAAVKLTDNWGYINNQDSLIIPMKFYSVQDFHDGLAGFRDKRLRTWGYINKEAEVVIPAKYQLVKPFINGVALVRYKGKWGYIDKKGTEYWED